MNYNPRSEDITENDTEFGALRLLDKQIPGDKVLPWYVVADGHLNYETENSACLRLIKFALWKNPPDN